MPRALICTVGGQPHPIATAVRENAPLDLVYFLCSRGRAQSASAVTVRRPSTWETERHCPHCGRDYVERVRVRPLAAMAGLEERLFVIEGVDDPDDLGQVLAACERIRADLRSRWPRGAVEVIANYTGGTKTMSLGLALFVLSRDPARWTLQLNRVAPGGRTDLVRVRCGDHPVPENLSSVLAEVAAGWAEELAESHDYHAAAAILSHALTHHRLASEDRHRLLVLRLRCRMLSARDRFAYGEALELALQSLELGELYAPRLRRLAEIVAALGGDEPWPDARMTGLELVDELCESAERMAAGGRFLEAFGRLRRATALLADLRLRRLFGIRRPSSDPRAAYEVLAARGDAVGRYFAEHGRTVSEFLDRLQASHGGLVPVADREAWSTWAPPWRAWLDGALEIL